ncbi:MAG TPA: PEP-CTERM sorting domain-containing protein [Armatimonadota bacterium]|nr:PEP-CTERM sorting domain-containing protein [Armatimonadota bacterium]
MRYLIPERVLRALPLVILLLVGCTWPAFAEPVPGQAPPSFEPFPIYGITVDQVFSSGQKDYTLTLSSGAYLLFEGTHYSIDSVWGFYAVNKTGDSANDMTASGADNGEWAWDQHPAHGTSVDVAGWLDTPKNEAMLTPATGSISKPFSYGQFLFTGTMPECGLHLTVTIPDGKDSPFSSGGNGGWVILQEIPEPGSLVAMLGAMGGLLGFIKIRRK